MEMEKVVALKDMLGELAQHTDEKVQENASRILKLVQPIFDHEEKKRFREERNMKWSWSQYYPPVEAQKAGYALTIVTKLYEDAQKEVDFLEKETQDLLHAIELLEDISEEEEKELTRQLRAVRQQRRVAKNFVELAQPMVFFVQENKAMVNKLHKLHSSVIQVQNKLERRTYTPRSATALELAFEKANQKVREEAEQCTQISS
ncbi:hypothetical protein [Phage f2b1]|nr:hypothetical protein [Phage f2b1]